MNYVNNKINQGSNWIKNQYNNIGQMVSVAAKEVKNQTVQTVVNTVNNPVVKNTIHLVQETTQQIGKANQTIEIVETVVNNIPSDEEIAKSIKEIWAKQSTKVKNQCDVIGRSLLGLSLGTIDYTSNVALDIINGTSPLLDKVLMLLDTHTYDSTNITRSVIEESKNNTPGIPKGSIVAETVSEQLGDYGKGSRTEQGVAEIRYSKDLMMNEVFGVGDESYFQDDTKIYEQIFPGLSNAGHLADKELTAQERTFLLAKTAIDVGIIYFTAEDVYNSIRSDIGSGVNWEDDVAKNDKSINNTLIYENKVPQKAYDIADEIIKGNGIVPEGYKGGRIFLNDGRAGGQLLPKDIIYKEYDINPYIKGQRGSERIIIGNDGSVWYTNNHYLTFTQIK